MRDLVLRFTEDPDWLTSVSRDITDAIHAELPDVDADPELRSSTYASTDSVLRLLADLSRSSLPPQEAVPPPAAVDYAREFVRRGLPLDSLLRAYHIGQAVFFARGSRSAAAVRAQVVESLLAGEPVDVDASSRRLGYELAREHQAFVVWSDESADGGEQALAMLERAALEVVRMLDAGGPLLHPIEHRSPELQVALRLLRLAQED